ncbi:MAG: CbtA family protein, partial [Gammaproteobacteria bacterium]|nr:CbtA family protein [Gammaproteobacteria bacterium]
MIFRRVVYYSILVGIVAGIVLTAVQRFQVVPIIFAAEAFEGASADVASGGDDGHDHEHWGPEDGFERTAYTAFSNALTAVGFALVLLSAILVAQTWSRERPLRPTWKRAIGWSLAGYAVFWLAPALGLPPEIPLQNAADLQDRQVWWVICVVCTAAGIGGLAFAPAPWRWMAPLVIA